ncbi:hypothetical protein QJS04_geneDACA003868 [Acorus gramineus]|uniref:Pectinesterase inhibitor domain-containing protein n=1 Tax=Acorus gramineus TaxID=55184 RepID=A0AAV9BJI3_ACOGR|nr:hypothetical protein QJS04_geneDACA003868 [Acorus gramineus]
MSTTTNLLLLLLVLTSSIQYSSADAHFIATTCNQTPHPAICKSLLESEQQSFTAVNARAFAWIAYHITATHASGTLAVLNKLLVFHDGEPIAAPMEVCAHLYGRAVEDLTVAGQSMTVEAYVEAAKRVDNARGAAGLCEKAFGMEFPSPVTAENRVLADDCSVTFDLLRMLSG